MPPASVEVVSPDLETVGQMRMSAGTAQQVDVPSEASFLRVHLPSGRVVTLRGDFTLDRTVHLADLERTDRPPRPSSPPPRTGATREQVMRYVAARGVAPDLDPDSLSAPTDFPLLADLGSPLLRTHAGAPVPGRVNADNSEVIFDTESVREPMTLRLQVLNHDFRVQLPGNTTTILARGDNVLSSTPGRDLHVAVQVRSRNADADAVLAYLTRGDMQAAESMTSWIDQAQDLLFRKIEDPYAAAVGAYLLLRLGRFDEMQDWARNLATLFPDIADGHIIWASQLIRQRGSAASTEIERYLVQAADGPLPVYAEGLRLLGDGLRLLPRVVGQPRLAKLDEQVGRSLWRSPFTAGVVDSAPSDPTTIWRVELDISIAPRA
jgi:hypothetical protein